MALTVTVNVSALLLLCGVTYISWRLLRHTSDDSVLKNITGPPSTSFWTGNLPDFFDQSKAWELHRAVIEEYGTVVRLHGLLGQPMLYVYDPKALHTVVIKDQHNFEEEISYPIFNTMFFGPGLLSTQGDHHRRQKRLLSPSFTASHLRHLVPIFYRVSKQLRKALSMQVKQEQQEIDVLGLMGRGALELVGQGLLGHSFDPLVEDPIDNLGSVLKEIMPNVTPLGAARIFLPFTDSLGSPAFRRRLLEMIPHKGVQRLKEISDIMFERSSTIYYEKKRKSMAGEDVKQAGADRDLLSVMVDTNMAASEEDQLPDTEIIAQLTTMTFAGTDTTSNTLSRILYVLSLHPDVQEDLRREIVEATNDRDLSHDEIVQLRYLDAVIRETMRVYPIVPILIRQAGRDSILPLSEPIRGRDGKMISEIPVPKGTDIMIGVQGSNCNKALWGEDAREWNPERWLKPLPDAVTNARIPGVYSNLMTFNGGGRSCIGFKFSELEIKVVLCALLPAFFFEPPKERVVWNFGDMVYPSMGDRPEARMLLKVTPLNSGT